MMLQQVDNKVKALDLAKQGRHVFPLVFRGKTPLTTNGFKDASCDPAEVERMFSGTGGASRNIGIATGASGLIVIDIDTKDGKQGEESWASLMDGHGEIDTLTVTTWSGGKHLYFWAPEGSEIKNSQSKLAPGIDVRAIGGYVVAPGSTVREGDKTGTYEIDEDWPIEDCPDWLYERLVEIAKKPEPQAMTGVAATSSEAEARVRQLSNEIAAIPVGEPGEGVVNSYAYMAGQYVGAGQVSYDDAVRILMDGISGWTWRNSGDFEKFVAKIERGVSDGSRNPRVWEDRSTVDFSEEVASAAESVEVAATEAHRDVTDWSTDIGQADYLRKNLVPLIHIPNVGWYAWDGRRWSKESEDFVVNLAISFYRKQFRAVLDKYKMTEDEKFYNLAKQFKRFMSASRLASIVSTMRKTPGIFTPDASLLDSHHELLNTPAGVVNMRTGEVGPHDKALLITKITRGNYRPGFKHPDWEKAQQALPEEDMDYLQLRMGQAATGYLPKDALFLIGRGKNGKSLFTTDGPSVALGDYAALSSQGLISKGGDAKAATPEKAQLQGVRFAWIEELPEAHALSVVEMKSLVETSSVKARFLNKDPFEFNATHSLFITANTLPAISETDDGTWRRMAVLHFNRKFVMKPEADFERQGDPGLKRRCKQGLEGQHDAILTWLVEGAMRYLSNETLVEEEMRPLSVVEGTSKWRESVDRIMGYWRERLVADPNAVVARADLYFDFSNWMASQGFAKPSQETFLIRFRDHDLTVKAGFSEIRTRDVAGLCRPVQEGILFDSVLPKLPTQIRAIKGFRFRTDADSLN